MPSALWLLPDSRRVDEMVSMDRQPLGRDETAAMPTALNCLWSACSSHKTEAFVLWRSIQYYRPELHRAICRGSQTV